MIRVSQSGRHYCDGKECGYPLSWNEGDPEGGSEGEWVCLDCNASAYAARPLPSPPTSIEGA